jgi:SET domain-containing protein
MRVKGDMKIGVYASTTIKAGSELFLDYGAEYFFEREILEIGGDGESNVVISSESDDDKEYVCNE